MSKRQIDYLSKKMPGFENIIQECQIFEKETLPEIKKN